MTKRNEITDDHRLVAELYTSGLSLHQTRQRTGRSYSYIWRAVRLCGGAKRPSTFTPEIQRELATAFANGETVQQIRERTGRDLASIRRAIRLHGGKLRIKNMFSAADQAAIREQYERGDSMPIIASQRGCSIPTIQRAIVEAGGRIRTCREANTANVLALVAKQRCFSDDEARIVAVRYIAGEPMRTIAESYGVSIPAVWNTLMRQGVDTRKHTRTHTLDESVFDDAENNPEAAYYIGLIMADGCVQRRPERGDSLSLALSGNDGCHVYSFRDFLKSTHAIGARRQGPKSYGINKKPSHRINIQSTKLVDTLSRYGIEPRKSLTAEVKILTMNRWFWCGAVCGDGWVLDAIAGKYRSPIIGLCGSHQMMQQFLDYAKTITDTTTEPTRVGKISRVRFGNYHAVRIIKALFKDSPFALPRKLATAMYIMDTYSDQPRYDYSWITRELLTDLYNRHGNWRAVHQELGIDNETLRNYRNQLGVDCDKEPWDAWITRELLDELYDKHKDWGDVAKEVGVCELTLLRIRIRRGMPIRADSRRR